MPRARRSPAWGQQGLLAPAVAYLVIFLAVPLVLLFAFGLVEIRGGRVVPGSWTLDHYARVLGDPFYYRIFLRTFWMGLAATGLCLLFGYPVAYLFTRVGPLARGVLLVVVLAPLLTNAVVRTFGWMIILGGQKGLLNAALLRLGVIDEPVKILYTMPAVLIGLTQIQLPFMILPIIAALEGQDRSLTEAAAGLGATWAQTFFHVIVPLSLPGVLTGAALVFVISYTNFAVPALLGGGSFAVIPTFIFEQISALLQWNSGAVLATLLLGTAMVMLWAFNRATARLLRWMR
ncbi:MAG: ABC transporter permease [Armatimonadota bacterium]|nr:ABC transporter permease [Armatimonadota bacterium]MDR7485928.1 ABC transporter permease [Armatimonadota bacterium]MDR7533121.1 ABC transporter permease [Armatimonadota bacterium]MDR7536633.1 ABC transporter permease [Armatimonadota bacterium]